MPTKTYHGSCQCKRVRFEADIDFSQGTSKCNCTSCWKRRWWAVKVAPEAFRPQGGEAELSKHVPGEAHPRGGFCKHCGVTPYGFVDATEWNPNAYVAVNVAVLDDLDPAELVESPLQLCDGRNDNWWNPPTES